MYLNLYFCGHSLYIDIDEWESGRGSSNAAMILDDDSTKILRRVLDQFRVGVLVVRAGDRRLDAPDEGGEIVVLPRLRVLSVVLAHFQAALEGARDRLDLDVVF